MKRCVQVIVILCCVILSGCNKSNIAVGVPVKNASDLSVKNMAEKNGSIKYNNEEYSAVYGESGALIWEYCADEGASPFEEQGYFICAFMGDGYVLGDWYSWSGTQTLSVEHIGEDIFEIECSWDYGPGFGVATERFFYNPKELLGFSWESKRPFYRKTNFNDGLAVGIYYQSTSWGTEKYVATINIDGDVTVSEISQTLYNWPKSNIPGKYSNGVFFFQGAFYDKDFNVVLDLADKDWGNVYMKERYTGESYAPYFENGVCTLITGRYDGTYWKFDINLQGEIISEVEQFDITQFEEE